MVAGYAHCVQLIFYNMHFFTAYCSLFSVTMGRNLSNVDAKMATPVFVGLGGSFPNEPHHASLRIPIVCVLCDDAYYLFTMTLCVHDEIQQFDLWTWTGWLANSAEVHDNSCSSSAFCRPCSFSPSSSSSTPVSVLLTRALVLQRSPIVLASAVARTAWAPARGSPSRRQDSSVATPLLPLVPALACLLQQPPHNKLHTAQRILSTRKHLQRRHSSGRSHLAST